MVFLIIFQYNQSAFLSFTASAGVISNIAQLKHEVPVRLIEGSLKAIAPDVAVAHNLQQDLSVPVQGLAGIELSRPGGQPLSATSSHRSL
jgi:hypothetical protein